MRLADLPRCAADLLTFPPLARRAEPSEAMEDPEQIADYTRGAARAGALAGAYRWQAARATQAIRGRRRVLDLGCASGAQLALIARLNPETRFTGLDLSHGMLAAAATYLGGQGCANIELRQGDMTRLPWAAGSFDAVISNMAFHHLPDFALVRAALAEIGRVLAPGGAVYVSDLLRPRRESSLAYLAPRCNARAPALLLEDYRHSMRAAWSPAEWRRAAAGLLPQARFGAMRPWPLMGALSTPLQALPAEARLLLRALAEELDGEGREALNDLRLGYLHQGLDPFRGIALLPPAGGREPLTAMPARA